VTRLTRVPPPSGGAHAGASLSHRDDAGRCNRCAAAGLISPRVSLTVSLTLCNFAALARSLTAPLELRTFIELAAAEPGLA
jgi:hypothetical protein